MELTFKKDIKTNSMVLRHNILLQATGLAVGREGALQTEKEIYLILSMMDNLVEEDLIELCNEDSRELSTIMVEDIEPLFNSLIEKPEYKVLYDDVKVLLLNRCKEVWDNEHSFYGVLDAMLTMIAEMDAEDKQEVLTATAKVAEQAFDRRTKVMEEKVDATNDKLAQLVNQYMESQGKQLEVTEDAE